MACAWDRATTFLLALLLLLLAGDEVSSAAGVDLSSSSGAIVLPLRLSYANSTRRSAGSMHLLGRRQLQGEEKIRTASARLRLYDDLLTNGYFTTRLRIGTPTQEFALIVDSGSTITYVPCSTCEQCGDHQDPRFQPDLSSTYQAVKCNIDCTCDPENVQCTYERQYAEMSSSSGVLGEDIVSFGKESELVPQRAVFGCENSETGDLFNQHADGIMGLGRGSLSIVDQLVEKGVINDSFSLCYGGMDIGGGAMVLGAVSPPPEMVFSNSDAARSPYYNIDLKEIQVSGKPLQLNPSIFDRKHGTVLDSGTTFAYLPQEAFEAFRDAIVSKVHLKQIHGPDPNYKDVCFSGASSDALQLSNYFPEVDMVFGNGRKLSLSPENYLFRHSKVHDAYCLGFFQNGQDATTLLGGIVVRNTLVTYDRQNERIGFWKTNCTELWERLHAQAATPSEPSPSYDSIQLSPAFSPSADDTLPGHFQIGLITFDITLAVRYLVLEPHITELAELIAHELEVNVQQVHLMNFTEKGNGTLIKCAISPSGSDFISNKAAMSIISRLVEHRIRLPENFGSFQLVEWTVEPPSRRAWLQQHLLGGVVGISVAVMLSFSAFLLWCFWRQENRGIWTYRQVDSALEEQELQTL